jgi:hypothetical protein
MYITEVNLFNKSIYTKIHINKCLCIKIHHLSTYKSKYISIKKISWLTPRFHVAERDEIDVVGTAHLVAATRARAPGREDKGATGEEVEAGWSRGEGATRAGGER